MIEPELRDIIEPELAEGEELLWAGRPQKHPFLFYGIYALVFAMVWIGAILYTVFIWIKGFFFSKDGSLLSTLDFLIGLTVSSFMLLFGYFLLRYAIIHVFAFKKQVYALTSKRGLILENHLKKRSLSFDQTALSVMHRDIQKSPGTLFFGFPVVLKKKVKDRLTLIHPFRLMPIFYNVENPDQLEALILDNLQRWDAS